MTCEPSEDSDQSGHSPSLISVFAVHMKKPWFLSYPFNTTEKTDQTGQIVGFVMWQLNLKYMYIRYSYMFFFDETYLILIDSIKYY